MVQYKKSGGHHNGDTRKPDAISPSRFLFYQPIALLDHRLIHPLPINNQALKFFLYPPVIIANLLK